MDSSWGEPVKHELEKYVINVTYGRAGMISQTTRTEKNESVILAVVFQKSLPAESFGRPANAGPNLEMRR